MELNKNVFREKLKEFEVIFGYSSNQDQMDLYYKYMKEKFSDEDFEKACLEILKTENRFPTIAMFYKHKPQFMGGAF